jgi:hypothetical protein
MCREGDFINEERDRIIEPGRCHTEKQASQDEGDLIFGRGLEHHSKNEEAVSNVDAQLRPYLLATKAAIGYVTPFPSQ